MVNADAYLNADASKINEDDKKMNISMEEEQETVEYKNTLKVDTKNISKTPPKTGHKYMKLLMINFWRDTYFYTSFLDLCRNNPNQPQFIPSDVKTVLKKGFETSIFPKPFLDLCKNNRNQPQCIPSDVKIVLKMDM